jgi:diguanylate cyclase (GGDEF)-like protein
MPSARSRPSAPAWLQWLAGRLLQQGLLRINLLLSLLAVGAAATAGALVMLWAGGGRPWEAALLAGVSCALLAPWVNALLLRLWCAIGQAGAGGERSRPLVDELTGVLMRLPFMAAAEREFARCRRYQMPAALLLIDADHFRRLNVQRGHACGDAVLRQIARLAQSQLRQADLVGRFGGEVLAVLLPHTDTLGALDVADRIRERVAGLRMQWREHAVHVTVSVGVAPLAPAHASIDALMHDADAALLAAKEAGRNCVRAAPIEPHETETPQRGVPRRAPRGG